MGGREAPRERPRRARAACSKKPYCCPRPQIHCNHFSPAPCNSPNWFPRLSFNHLILLTKSILHIAATGVCLKFKTALSPAQNLSRALRLQSCIISSQHLSHAHFSPFSSPSFPCNSGPLTTLISQFIKQNEFSSATRSLHTHYSF